jgi:hypothetical protein
MLKMAEATTAEVMVLETEAAVALETVETTAPEALTLGSGVFLT